MAHHHHRFQFRRRAKNLRNASVLLLSKVSAEGAERVLTGFPTQKNILALADADHVRLPATLLPQTLLAPAGDLVNPSPLSRPSTRLAHQKQTAKGGLTVRPGSFNGA